MDFLADRTFQILWIPIILAGIAQGLLLLGKYDDSVESNDFSSVPYSLETAALAINATFAITKPSLIASNYGWLFILILGLIGTSLLQKYLSRRYGIIATIVCIPFATALISLTYFVWG